MIGLILNLKIVVCVEDFASKYNVLASPCTSAMYGA
jgi:hypothetical protein